MDKREDVLFDESLDVEHELFTLIEYLINAEWDSDTLKGKIESLMKQKDVIDQELYKLQESEKQ